MTNNMTELAKLQQLKRLTIKHRDAMVAQRPYATDAIRQINKELEDIEACINDLN